MLIYKFESFDLFKKMIQKVNKDIISFLFKGNIPVNDPENVKDARAPEKNRYEQTSHRAQRYVKAEVMADKPIKSLNKEGQNL